jgi:hypothetical protein
VSRRRQGAVVSRSYDPAPDQCVRALELLLKQPISKEGGPPTAPENAKERIKDDFRATKKYTGSP